MEGVSQEAASLAGHLGLSNLVWIYDNNQITIEGNTSLAFSDDVAARFMAYHWNVLRVGDANDLDSIDSAPRAAHDWSGPPHDHLSSIATSPGARPTSRTPPAPTASRSAKKRYA